MKQIPEPVQTPKQPRKRFFLGHRALIALIVVQILACIALLASWRASQTLDEIVQEDPRRRPPVADATPVAQAVVEQPSQVAPPDNSLPTSVAPTPATLPRGLRQPFTVLLIGVDERPKQKTYENTRSDVLILVRVDPIEKWASMLSIPRDSVATIPRYGPSKINAAYTLGYLNADKIYGRGTPPDAAGAALAAETVEQFLGTTVDYTAQVNIRGFQQLIDALGGVMIDVERPILDAVYPTEDYGVERLYIPAGLQVMNGRQALAYARTRHGSSDFDRSRRQQQVLRSVFDEVKTRGIFANLGLAAPILEVLEQNVRTTLPINDLSTIAGGASLAQEFNVDRIVQLRISPEDVRITSEVGSDLYWNKNDLAVLVKRWMSGPEGAEAARIQILNGSGVPGTALKMTSFLEASGFELITPANAEAVSQRTQIIDYTNSPFTRERLAKVLQVDPTLIEVRKASAETPTPINADIVIIVGQDVRSDWLGQ